MKFMKIFRYVLIILWVIYITLILVGAIMGIDVIILGPVILLCLGTLLIIYLLAYQFRGRIDD